MATVQAHLFYPAGQKRVHCRKKKMETLLIYAHVAGAVVVLLVGLVEFINRKGSVPHILLGRIYVGAMWTVCASAFGIIGFFRFNAFLMVVAVLTFYASFMGLRVVRRKQLGNEKWYDWAVAILTALFGIGLIGYGIYALVLGKYIFALLCGVFGVITAQGAIQDIVFFVRQNPNHKLWWLKQHIGAMGGSYIAAITAFAVQNPDFFMPGSPHQWILWLLPAAIGSPIIARITKQYVKAA